MKSLRALIVDDSAVMRKIVERSLRPSHLPIGNTDDDEFTMLRAQVEKALAGEIATGNVAVRRTSEGLVISLREVGFFDSGSADIQASSQPAFQRLVEVLLATGSDIRVEGHTD